MLFALLAAVFMAIGIVVRQRATMDVPPEHGVSMTLVTTLVRKRLWWIGTAVAVVGYACQALALARGSLMLVQPLLVSSLLFALPLSARLAGRRVTRGEWMWALLLTLGLALFTLMARPSTGEYRGQLAEWVVVAVVFVPLVAGCVLIGARVHGRWRAALIAVAVGVLFGVVALLTKIVMHALAEEGIMAFLRSPELYVLIVLGIAAVLLQQSAFHAGALQMSVPTMMVLEPVVAVLLGAFVLGEHLTVSGVATVVLPIALVAMAAATIALGRDEGAYEEQLEAALVRRD